MGETPLSGTFKDGQKKALEAGHLSPYIKR